MATPIYACGAECGVQLTTGPHFSVAGGTISFDTGTVRTGVRSIRSNPTSASGYFESIALASSTDWVIRAYVRFATVPSATRKLIGLGSSSAGAGAYFNSSDSKLYAGSDTTTLGASGVSVTTGVWYRLDIKTTSTTVDLQVDGTAAGQLSGTYSAATKYTIGALSSTTQDVFFDDILVSQTTADYPLGAGFVKSYIPNADGTHVTAGANDFEYGLTGTDIAQTATDVYTYLDDRPLPSTAVDFITAKAPATTEYVEWQYEDSTEADPPRAVEGLIIHHDAGGAGTNDFAITLREHAGGTSGDIWTGTTNVGATITGKRAIFITVPGTADAWTTTKFNALRSRFVVADASPDVYLDAAMLEAEFPEVASGPQTVSDPALLGGATMFGPSVLQQVAITAVLGIATLFSPQVNQSVAPPLLGGAVQFAPTVMVDQTVSDPALLGPAAQFSPTVNQSVANPALLGPASQFAPQVNQSILAPALQGPATQFTPTVQPGPVTVSDPALLGPAVSYAPQVNQSVAPPLLGGAVQYAPTVLGAQTVSDPALLGGAVSYAPQVNQQVANPALLGPAATFAPQVNQQAAPGLLGPASQFAPQVNQSVLAPALLGPAVTFAPTVSISGGPQTVTDPALLGPAVQFAPQVNQSVANPALLGPASQFAPQVNQSVLAPALLGPASQFAPQVNQSVALAAVQGPAVLYAPEVRPAQTVTIDALLGGAVVYAPEVSAGAAQTVTIDALLGGAVQFAPSVYPQGGTPPRVYAAHPAPIGHATTDTPPQGIAAHPKPR